MTSEEGHVLDRSHRAMYRRIGVIAGLILMGAAVYAVARNGAIVDSLSRAITSPHWDALLLLVASVFAMQLLSSAVFHRLMNAHGPVGFFEMNALVAASTLGNYVPMQAGSLGRVAYHHAVNGIPLRASLVAIVQAMLASFIALCLVGAGALFGRAAGAPWWAVLALPVLWLPFMLDARARIFATVLFLKTIETFAWALHAWAAFKLSGWTIEPETAIWVALVGGLANLVPFIGNGLGIREWAVALSAPMLGGYVQDAGLAAELVGRAVDIAIAVPLGLVGFAYLVRRARAVSAKRPESAVE